MTVRLVNWPVERLRWDLSGALPDERILIHWACVEDDAFVEGDDWETVRSLRKAGKHYTADLAALCLRARERLA